MGRIQVVILKFTILQPYGYNDSSQEEGHHINIDSPRGPKTEKGGVSNNSGRTKGKGAHLEGRNQ